MYSGMSTTAVGTMMPLKNMVNIRPRFFHCILVRAKELVDDKSMMKKSDMNVTMTLLTKYVLMRPRFQASM